MIHFRCPRCGQTFIAPEPAAGARTDCPECGQRVAVPAVPPTVVHRARTTDQSRGAKTASPAKTTAHPPSSQTRVGELTGDGGEVPEVQPAWDVELVPAQEKQLPARGASNGRKLLWRAILAVGGVAALVALAFAGLVAFVAWTFHMQGYF